MIINVNKQHFGQSTRLSKFNHYTSAEALTNIISKSSIRLTHCAFLNDIEEYLYIDEVLTEIIEDASVDNEIRSFIKAMFDQIDRDYSGIVSNPIDKLWFSPVNADYYVLSGSSKPDSLSLWNYYVKNNSYSLY